MTAQIWTWSGRLVENDRVLLKNLVRSFCNNWHHLFSVRLQSKPQLLTLESSGITPYAIPCFIAQKSELLQLLSYLDALSGLLQVVLKRAGNCWLQRPNLPSSRHGLGCCDLRDIKEIRALSTGRSGFSRENLIAGMCVSSKDAQGIEAHMQKHAECFDHALAGLTIAGGLGDLGVATWSHLRNWLFCLVGSAL